MSVKISIIGSAGRGNDAKHVSCKRFEAMVNIVETMILNAEYKWDQIQLISGGAAFSDHIAVALFLKHPDSKLILYLPCPWDTTQYHDTGSSDWCVNPGRISNKYHTEFTTKIGYNSLLQIEEAHKKGAILDTTGRGFHSRNLKVSNCQILIAFTSATGNEPPSDGGTSHTWKASNKYNPFKVHIPLSSLPL